jgi:hypothetical protein
VVHERAGEITLARKQSTNAFVRRGEIALPVCVVRVGIRELLSDRQRRLVAFLNLRTINGNANMKGEMVAGSVRRGGGLLIGLLRCGHRGRKLKVLHNGPRGGTRYVCNDASVNHGRGTKCISFGNLRIDAAVSAEVLALIAPLGLDAALQANADRERAGTERLRQIGAGAGTSALRSGSRPPTI